MKKILMIIIIIILLILTYFVCNNIRINKIEKTKKINYSEVIETTKEVKLYDKNYKEIGNIDTGAKIYLEKTNYKNDYYKLLDEDYYIYYENIKPIKEDIKEINYLPFNTSIMN